MPTIIPITGADESPSEDTITCSVDGSVDVVGGTLVAAMTGLSIKGSYQAQSLRSVNVRKDIVDQSEASLDIGFRDTFSAHRGIVLSKGEDFMILADLVQLELAQAATAQTDPASSATVSMNGRLTINGNTLNRPKIKSFTYTEPTGRLGSILSVRLAEPDVALIPTGAVVDFDIEVTVNGSTAVLALMKGGKLQERDSQIAMAGERGPNDEVGFSATDVVADKFTLGPRQAVVMFDPYRSRYDQLNTRNDNLIRDENHGLIYPKLEPVGGLTMKQVLDRAYTGRGGSTWLTPFIQLASLPTLNYWQSLISNPADDPIGCGFDDVITNIPDYPVRRADFTIENGWHGGAQPVVGMFSPVYFVHDLILFIMDVERALPAGITAHYVPLSVHKSITERIEYKPDTNAILLTYQYIGNDPIEDPRKEHQDKFTDEIIDETGTAGEIGYSKTTVRRWDRQFFFSDTPEDILDTLPLSVETETVQTVVYYDADGTPVRAGNKVTHQETIDYLYDGDLKIRHIKVVKAAIAHPSTGDILVVPVQSETCDISWTEDHNNPGLKLQASVRTDIRNVCAYDGVNTETVIDPDLGEFTFARLIPVLDAQASGIISGDWRLTDLVPTKSIRERLTNMKGNQYDVEVIETDYLNNTVKRSYTQPVTGSVQNDPYEAKSRTVLLRDVASESSIGTRIPQEVNALELPREQALLLGKRALARLKDPLKTLPVQLPAVDFAVKRGSVIQGQKRVGNTGKYFVTGFTISGESLGRVGHKISQTLEPVEIAQTT